MKTVSTLRRDEHPTLETFERVLGKGVMVDCGPEDRRRDVWDSNSIAGVDLLEFRSGRSSYGLPDFETDDDRNDE